MKKLDFYWMSKENWWDLENYIPVLRSDAPKEAQDSYKHYLEQCRKFDEIYGKGKWNQSLKKSGLNRANKKLKRLER